MRHEFFVPRTSSTRRSGKTDGELKFRRLEYVFVLRWSSAEPTTQSMDCRLTPRIKGLGAELDATRVATRGAQGAQARFWRKAAGTTHWRMV
jgi:hypothetical protein